MLTVATAQIPHVPDRNDVLDELAPVPRGFRVEGRFEIEIGGLTFRSGNLVQNGVVHLTPERTLIVAVENSDCKRRAGVLIDIPF